MLERVNKFYQILHVSLIILICLIVLIAYQQGGQENLLAWTSQENGIFEWASFFVVFTMSAFALMVYFHAKDLPVFRQPRRNFILFIAILSYLAAMEEISWGQHVFGFESGGFFEKHNVQQETNLHDFFAGELVNKVIHLTVYIFFIFLPLFIYFKPDLINHSPSIRGKIIIYLPSLHNVMMFCFACTLQQYFQPGTLLDTILIVLALVLILILFITNAKYRTRWHMIHFSLIILSMALFMYHADIFSAVEGQYEIRELVYYYAIFYWFINWTTNLKNKVALQLR